ncbi:hypothetical protein ACFPT7_11260 [Acidicapsa dinghuensis]|uniref:Uncharacterized protein n=1 Tax=Acidicapsa dinghuensis TaxID=2218256 RepID=A0ABW1EHX3_9BACT|nr:hypothetical protein [Acidicapsa dinghuensis]
MPAILFKFQEDDPVVTGYIKRETLDDVERWQTRDDYDFELHSGHLTGYPIYIRTVQYARATSNIPKFDTLNKSATDYTQISDFANADKLGSLPLPAKNEILTLIANNWEAFSELAQNYWNNTPVSTKTREEIEHEAWVNAETSDTGQHFDQISLNQFRSMYCL